ncbi:hypothetical protein HanPSC8_Chr10g0431371 [Helianthus annuus]|nr:hypothetical protein HanPSC8_Chr10g0431371 [Helianthus annuus]
MPEIEEFSRSEPSSLEFYNETVLAHHFGIPRLAFSLSRLTLLKTEDNVEAVRRPPRKPFISFG